MSDMCTCGVSFTDEYCPRHGVYKPTDRELHKLMKERDSLQRTVLDNNLVPRADYDQLTAENEKLHIEIGKLKNRISQNAVGGRALLDCAIDSSNKEIERLKAERDKAKDEWFYWNKQFLTNEERYQKTYENENKVIQSLRSKLAVAVEALEFYAGDLEFNSYGIRKSLTYDALRPVGERAREALEKLRGES